MEKYIYKVKLNDNTLHKNVLMIHDTFLGTLNLNIIV